MTNNHPPDERGIRLLSLVHYVSGVLLLAAIPFLIQWGLQFSRLYMQSLESAGELDTPNMFYLIVAVVCLVTAVFVVFHGGLYLFGGWCLGRRRHLDAVIAVAVTNALIVPFGTILSVWTWLVLRKPENKALFKTKPENS